MDRLEEIRQRCAAASPVLIAEKACAQRNIEGCDRDCEKCDLVRTDDELINGFDASITVVNDDIPYLISNADQLISRVAKAEAALVESQRREQAAVKCIGQIDDALNFQRLSAAKMRIAEWRGQEAGKEKQNEN